VAVAEEEPSVEVVAEETGLSGIDNSGDQRSRDRWRLREFWDESERTRGELLFIGSKISGAVLN
jgi:hypothetical protein